MDKRWTKAHKDNTEWREGLNNALINNGVIKKIIEN